MLSKWSEVCAVWFRGDEVFKHACGIAVTRQNLDRQLWDPDRFPAVWTEPPPPSPPPARRSYDTEASCRRAGATHKERGDPFAMANHGSVEYRAGVWRCAVNGKS